MVASIVLASGMALSQVAAADSPTYTIKVLGNLGVAGISEAYDINDSGEVVGVASGRGTHAFLYKDGQMQDLGTLGGTFSKAWGINNSGQVVGEADTSISSARRAFLYSESTGMKDLGALGGVGSSRAHDVNNSGQVVGQVQVTVGGIQHAFLYSESIGMQDLNNLIPADSGFVLHEALAINTDGQIVGWGLDSNDNRRAFV